MRHISLYLLLAVFATLLNTSCGRVRGDYDVYLLLGQSNMAGRGTMLSTDTTNVIEGVWLLNAEGEPESAVAPLNRYSTIRKDLSIQQICPGDSFSAAMHDATGRKILLVVNARGGSSLEQWMPSNSSTSFFEDAVTRARQASEYGDVKAILWHQGESNSNRTEHYLDSLSVFVSALRQALGDEDSSIPFVAGEIAQWHKNAVPFNSMIAHISEYIPNSYCVSSAGCSQHGGKNDPHFSRDGQILLGKRYAEKVLEVFEN